MKKIENDFSQLFGLDNVNFYGNVWLGKKTDDSNVNTVSISDLQKHYSAVILANGALSDKKLGLPNEDKLQGVYGQRTVVDWYNGSLDFTENRDFFSLEGV